MLNRIAWNRTVFWYSNCVLILKWIVWNRTVYIYIYIYIYIYKGFGINNLQWLICHKTQTKPKSGAGFQDIYSKHCVEEGWPQQVARTGLFARWSVLEDVTHVCPYSDGYVQPLVCPRSHSR